VTAPLIAIVGRPNVGKSTLYNRMVGGRPALVHDTPGLTRDRRYGELEYYGTELRVVDTGGLDPEAEAEVIGAGIHRQARRAIDEADVILLVVDGTAGVNALDYTVAELVRGTGKPVVLAVNKIDHLKRESMIHEFHELGLGEPYPVSAAHGRGADELVEAVIRALPAAPEAPAEEAEPTALRIAFVGKPNAGKSSLVNRLVGEERSLVHDMPGTTTDPVDTEIELRGKRYMLVDTAGIRRKAKVDEDIEKISVTMALSQIARADVVVLVIDAATGPAEQDARLAGMVEDAGRALVIALNKSDLVPGNAAQEKLRQLAKDTFHFLTWAPTTQLSARRGDGVDKLMDTVDRVAAEHARRIPTAELNRFFAEVCEEVPPPVHRGKAVRVQYLTQATIKPPTFLLFATAEGMPTTYKRFVANQLRKRYGFRGTPLRVFARTSTSRSDPRTPEGSSKPPKRRSRPAR
jgi:GTP-binding protein